MPSPKPSRARSSSHEIRDKYKSDSKLKHKSKVKEGKEYSRPRYTSDDDSELRKDKYKESKKIQHSENNEKNSKYKEPRSKHYEDLEERSKASKIEKYKESKKVRQSDMSEEHRHEKYKESESTHLSEESEETHRSKPRHKSYDNYERYSRSDYKHSGRNEERHSRHSKYKNRDHKYYSDEDVENKVYTDLSNDETFTQDPNAHEYRRYWGRDQPNSQRRERQSGSKYESSSRHKSSDRYWSKYPVNEEGNSVGPRYYEKKFSRRSCSKDTLKRKRNTESDEDSSRTRKTQQVNDKKRSKDSEKYLNDPGVHKPPSTPNEVMANNTISGENVPVAMRPKKNMDMLTTKTGGAYIPPARLRMMQAQITDKSSAAYQRLSWEALKKSIHGHINKVNVANIGVIVRELLKENVVRGRGLLCRSIIQAQAASPTFTHVYAALVSVINSKFPNIGELLLRRLIIQFKRGFKRNDKSICISAASFIAHLVNQRIAHEILALEILTLLVQNPTDDSVEVAIAFLKECGMKLLEVSSKGIHAIFEMLRNILHEGHLDIRVQYMIEVMFQVRKDNFRDHEAVVEELDLVEEEDQFTHLLMLEDVKDPEDILNVFKLDPEYEENEAKYKALKKEILDEGSSDSGSESGDEDESEEESENEEEVKESTIIDNTETNLIGLRRTIYLTIHSSLDFEECAHKLMRMELKPGQEIELCHMFLDCCAEQRTYEKFFGLLAQRFCQINKMFIAPFQQIFQNTYNTIHRLDTNKLRNVAKFFAHLLFTDAISWEVLSLIHLNEEETTSSSRIFIKILFQELSEYMGLTKLNERVKDGTLQEAFEGLFPRDNPKNTRFAINFFTSIGLGGLTDELREHLKSQPRVPVVPKIAETVQVSSESSSSDSSSSSSSSDSSSDTSSSSSSSDSEDSSDHSKSKSKPKSKPKSKSKKSSNKVVRESVQKQKSRSSNNKFVQKKKSIEPSPHKQKKKKK